MFGRPETILSIYIFINLSIHQLIFPVQETLFSITDVHFILGTVLDKMTICSNSFIQLLNKENSAKILKFVLQCQNTNTNICQINQFFTQKYFANHTIDAQ